MNETAMNLAVLEVENLIQQIAKLEEHFRRLEAIINQLQTQRDIYKALYEATL